MLIWYKLNSRGIIIMAFSFLWMVLIRSLLLINNLDIASRLDNETLISLSNGFWLLMSWAIYQFYKDVQKIFIKGV